MLTYMCVSTHILTQRRSFVTKGRDLQGTWHSFTKSTQSHWSTVTQEGREEMGALRGGEANKEESQAKDCPYQGHRALEVADPHQLRKSA